MIILRLPQLEEITRGLTYMHDQGIVHGDLKGVRIEPLTTLPTHRLTNLSGERPSRSQWSRLRIGLQSTHDCLGPTDLFSFKHDGWHDSMDEPGTPRPGAFRFEEESSDEGV